MYHYINVVTDSDTITLKIVLREVLNQLANRLLVILIGDFI